MLKISGLGMEKARIYLLIILSVSLILRFCSVFLYTVPVDKDAARYDTIAWNLVQGKGFSIEPGTPAFLTGPTYPTFLAFIYSIFGHSYSAVIIVQALLSTLTCFMIYPYFCCCFILHGILLMRYILCLNLIWHFRRKLSCVLIRRWISINYRNGRKKLPR